MKKIKLIYLITVKLRLQMLADKIFKIIRQVTRDLSILRIK
jgi:hypothetical protein